MAIVALRPNATIALNGWVVTGAPSAESALSDNADGTYVGNGGANQYLVLDNSTVAIPARGVIKSLTPRIRTRGDGSNHIEYLLSTADGYFATGNKAIVSSTVSTITGAAILMHPAGRAWTQADIDGIRLYARTPGGADAYRIYEAYVDVNYNEAPVATVTTPTEGGSVSDTTKPPIGWSYADPENDLQERFHVKVYTNADASLGGFNPEDGSIGATGQVVFPVWDSGEVLSGLTSVALPIDLTNGVAYKAFVKVADAGSNGRYSTWDSNVFTINVTAPPKPSLVVTAQPTNADGPRVKLDLTRTSSATPTTYMTIEKADGIEDANLLLNINASRFANDVSAWVAYTNNAEAAPTLQHFIDSSVEGGAYMRAAIAANTAGARKGARVNKNTPEVVGRTYTARALVRSSVAGNVRIWVDPTGNAQTVALAASTWTIIHYTWVSTSTATGNLFVWSEIGGASNLDIAAVDWHEGTRTTYKDPGISSLIWQAVRGAEKVMNTPDGTKFTFYDYEPPPQIRRQYRASAVRTV